MNKFTSTVLCLLVIQFIADAQTLAQPVFPAVAHDIQYTPVSTYPFMLRDIAVWVPDSAGKGEDIVTLVQEKGGTIFVRADLFDTFTKDGRTSYAYHLVFQSHEKTLSDDEVNIIMQAVTDELNGREGWSVR